MPAVSIYLAIASLFVLVTGVWAWRLTSSRPLMINVGLSSAFLLLAGYAYQSHQRIEYAFVLPFFATMLLAGRAIGLMWRSRREEDLRTPGWLMTAISVVCATVTIMAYRSIT